jgi:hypothetical protein
LRRARSKTRVLRGVRIAEYDSVNRADERRNSSQRAAENARTSQSVSAYDARCGSCKSACGKSR